MKIRINNIYQFVTQDYGLLRPFVIAQIINARSNTMAKIIITRRKKYIIRRFQDFILNYLNQK